MLILLSWPRGDNALLEEAKLFALQEAEFGCGQARNRLTFCMEACNARHVILLTSQEKGWV